MSKKIKMLLPYIDEEVEKIAWKTGDVLIMTDSGKVRAKKYEKYYKIDLNKEGVLFEYVNDGE